MSKDNLLSISGSSFCICIAITISSIKALAWRSSQLQIYPPTVLLWVFSLLTQKTLLLSTFPWHVSKVDSCSAFSSRTFLSLATLQNYFSSDIFQSFKKNKGQDLYSNSKSAQVCLASKLSSDKDKHQCTCSGSLPLGERARAGDLRLGSSMAV